jgi:hypothetical protein
VALPTEHGGWGLTLEPGLLGLLLAPSVAGACLAAVGLVAFLARTPLKIVAVDRRRHRWLPRTRLAATVAAAELALLAVLVAVVVVGSSSPRWWAPLAAAAPLFAVEAWFEVRSRGRRLLPELAGATGVAALAAAVALAGGAPATLALAAWAVLAARSATSIPHVRAQIARLHGRTAERGAALWGDVGAVVLAAAAVLVDTGATLGAAGVVAIVAIQRGSDRRPVPRPAVIGMRQMALGLGLVVLFALGAAVT